MLGLIIRTVLITTFTVALCCGFSSELTDAQVQAAIERGKGKRASVQGFVNVKSVSLTSANAVPVALQMFVYSDSDRIAMAAASAAHDAYGRFSVFNTQARRSKHEFSFSVQDARATASPLGVVVWVVLEVADRSFRQVPENREQWGPPHVQMTLKADDKMIEPLTRAGLAALLGDVKKMSDFTKNLRFVCPAPACAFSDFVFPVIEGAQELTVIVTSGDGRRKEKKVDPKLFEPR
jgi:hypothetical protein